MIVCPVELARKLVQCPSVTPKEGGALALLEGLLKEAGFETYRVIFEGDGSYPVDNLYARYGQGHPHVAFAGHTDVVPAGDESAWTKPPFGGVIEKGRLYGRGAEDMKSAIASYVSAAMSFLKENPSFSGSLSFLITGDEEADSINGTAKLIDWVYNKKGETIDACIVGEPTNEGEVGTIIKNGRRGSFTAKLEVFGKQGHVAYPDGTINPIKKALPLLLSLIETPFDEGNEAFPKTNLEITSVDVGNAATNVVPALLSAQFNVRFNNQWTPESLEQEIRRRLNDARILHCGGEASYELTITKPVSESFLTEAPLLLGSLQKALCQVIGKEANFSTGGGTSDARFIKNYCPVVEFGLVYNTLHQIDESTPIEDIEKLSKIYLAFLNAYFNL